LALCEIQPALPYMKLHLMISPYILLTAPSGPYVFLLLCDCTPFNNTTAFQILFRVRRERRSDAFSNLDVQAGD
jgi:hypothetical protein